MSARDLYTNSIYDICRTYLFYNYNIHELCLIILKYNSILLEYSFQPIFSLMSVSPPLSLSTMTITELEAVLDGCLSIMDVCMNRKMELEGRCKKRRASLTQLSPEQFNEITNSIFQTIYEEDIAVETLIRAKKGRKLIKKDPDSVLDTEVFDKESEV